MILLFIYLVIIDSFEREREREGREKERGRKKREKHRGVVPLFIQSLVDSCMRPDQGLNPQPWQVRTTLQTTELPSQGLDMILLNGTLKPSLVWLRGLGRGLGSLPTTFILKGHWFNSQLGHVPGLQARSLGEGVREATGQCFSQTHVSLPLFLSPFSPKINKPFKNETHKGKD